MAKRYISLLLLRFIIYFIIHFKSPSY